MVRSFQINTKCVLVTLRSRHQKTGVGGGCTTERSRMVHTFPFSFFSFFALFFIFWFFIFSFVYCVLILSVAVVFCYFFVLAIVVQSCKIWFKRIYLRSVAFKLFFGVVGSLMCFYALRSEINEFCLFLCVFLSRCFLWFCFFLYSNTIINYDGLLVIM